MGTIVEYLFSTTIVTLLTMLLFILTARSLLMMLAPDSDHPIVNMIFNVSDYIMSPARYMIDKTGWFADSPIDMAHLITMLAILALNLLFLVF